MAKKLRKKKQSILIIEDEQMLMSIMETKLKKAGYQIFKAENGLKGLDIAFKERPDLILLDLIMPVMDGISFLEKLRQNQWGRSAKVIVTTNLNDGDHMNMALKDGVSDYFIKSNMTPMDIVLKVEEKLGK